MCLNDYKTNIVGYFFPSDLRRRPQNGVWHSRKQRGNRGGGVVIAAVRLSGRFHTETETETGNSTAPRPSSSPSSKSSPAGLLSQRLYKSQERGPRRLTFSPDPLLRRPCPSPAGWAAGATVGRFVLDVFCCFCWWGNLLRCTKEDKFHTHTQVLSLSAGVWMWSFLCCHSRTSLSKTIYLST